ncbi:MAG: extracellular solute-binding protein, partial [Anaerolineae bacterium]|nr:extracellular solute-binding protein [Anaerolineae bacterium]
MQVLITRRHAVARFGILALVLAACSAPLAPAPTGESIAIAFMTSVGPVEFWEDRIAAFEETHPGIHVEPYYRPPPDDWPRQADAVLGFDIVQQDLIDRGWILDLTPLIASDERFDADDFHPGVLEVFQQEGHTWAIPVGITLWAIMVYSPAVFHEVGAPLPNPRWTWGDVAEAARLLSGKTADGRERYSVLDDYTLSNIAIEWIAERSGGLYREEGRDII